MVVRSGKFEGNNPFEISKKWISEAEVVELNDPNAIALSTVSEAVSYTHLTLPTNREV